MLISSFDKIIHTCKIVRIVLRISTSLHYAVILDNSFVVRKKETKEKIEKDRSIRSDI